MKITKIHIKKFRGFQDEDFEIGTQLTAIAGQNGTQKSTLLGIITQTYTLKEGDPMKVENPLCGGSYRSGFKDKFRLSPTFDKPKGHEWTISFDEGIADFTVESIKRTGDPNVRFWKKGSKKEGDGYFSFPTIFLSLKRLVPVAEEIKIETNDALLTENELEEFKQLHNKILITQVPISSATAITSKNKQSLGVSTALYDWNQNSMGQDNLGKIILALFSFKRLKNKYPEQYKGGILAIDEMDATMYPAAQVELLKVLRKYASKLKLQILFTTHSMSLLKAMDDLIKETHEQDETSNQIKIIYLKRVDNKIEAKQNTDFESIQLDLNVVAEGNKRKKSKVTVYTEDKENTLFVKSILKSKARALKFVNITMSCSMLIDLVNKKIPAFRYPYSIVVLDGDIRLERANLKKIKNADNVLVLPGNSSPERLIANFLYNLSDANPLWETVANGYTKQVCFRNYSFEQINATGEDGRQNAKKWFNEQLGHCRGNENKILNPFWASIKQDCDNFKSDFNKMIRKYIHD
jgi:AAA15 family ATPase/GTPase